MCSQVGYLLLDCSLFLLVGRQTTVAVSCGCAYYPLNSLGLTPLQFKLPKNGLSAIWDTSSQNAPFFLIGKRPTSRRLQALQIAKTMKNSYPLPAMSDWLYTLGILPAKIISIKIVNNEPYPQNLLTAPFPGPNSPWLRAKVYHSFRWMLSTLTTLVECMYAVLLSVNCIGCLFPLLAIKGSMKSPRPKPSVLMAVCGSSGHEYFQNGHSAGAIEPEHSDLVTLVRSQ